MISTGFHELAVELTWFPDVKQPALLLILLLL